MIFLLSLILDSLINELENEGTTISFIFYDLKNDSTIAQYYPNRRLPPASIQKVITTFTALKVFKKNFSFKTYFFRFKDELYVFPNGDPLLKDSDLDVISKKIYELGYRKFSKLYYDDSYFTKSKYPKGWFWDELDESYAPPIRPLVLNEGIFTLTYKFAPKHNFNNLYVKLIKSNVLKYEIISDTILVYGDFNRSSSLTFPQKEPEQFFLWSLKNALYKNNVVVDSVAGFKELPDDAILIYTYESKPLDSILKYMNLESSNLIAEMILRSIGAWIYSRGDWENSIRSLKRILYLEGVDTNFIMYDGSGLSRYNLISPKTFIQIYKSAYKDESFFKDFLNVLVEPGEGTLKGRLKQLKGRLKAKTGTLRNTVSLTGVIDERIAFCIIIYGFNNNPQKYRNIIDNLVLMLGAGLEPASPNGQ